MMRTSLHFDHLTGHPDEPPLVVDAQLDAFDVVDRLRVHLGRIHPGAVVDIDVDLSDGARDGRFHVYAGVGRLVGQGSIRITEHDESAERAVVVTYPTGDAVLLGDVVQVGRAGTAIHQVIEVAPAEVWLRETTGRQRQSTQPPGALRLLERQFG